MLPPTWARQFCDLSRRVLLVDERPLSSTYSTGCYMVAPEVEDKLRRKLLERRAAVLIREDEVAKRPDGRLLLAGLFAVPHKEDFDRMIFDRRPQKFEEIRLGWAKLPHGCQFCYLILEPSETIRASGEDLSTYFYQLKQLPSFLSRNAFGRSFDGGDYLEYGGLAGVRYRMALSVIPMGDLNAVDIAQETHFSVLRTQGVALSPMEYGAPIGDARMLTGVHIDDLIIAFICKKSFRHTHQEWILTQ